MELPEWVALRDTAHLRAERAAERHAAARQRLARTSSPTARLEVARAARAHALASRNYLALRVLWATGAREHEIVELDLATFEWHLDGRCSFILNGKAAPRTREQIEAGVPLQKRPRVAALPQPLASDAKEWLAEQNGGTIPTVGRFWSSGQGPGLSTSALERAVDAIAREAGIQRLVGPRPFRNAARAPEPGSARSSHRHHVHTHAIRELSERTVLSKLGPVATAKMHGHSVRTLLDSYSKYDVAEAFAAADIRSDAA